MSSRKTLLSLLLAGMFTAALLAPPAAHPAVVAARPLSDRPAWQRVFDRVPPALLPEQDVSIRQVSWREMEDLVAQDPDQPPASEDDGEVQGLFFLDEDDEARIYLLRGMSASHEQMVLAHELGHMVWDTHLTRSEQRAYEKAFHEASGRDRLVSEYAADSIYEGFAEAFAFFVMKPDVLQRRDPVSHAALRAICTGRKSEPKSRSRS